MNNYRKIVINIKSEFRRNATTIEANYYYVVREITIHNKNRAHNNQMYININL